MKFIYKNSNVAGIPSVIEVPDDYILSADETWEQPQSSLFKPTLVDGKWTGVTKAEFEAELNAEYPRKQSQIQQMIAALTMQVTTLSLEVNKLKGGA